MKSNMIKLFVLAFAVSAVAFMSISAGAASTDKKKSSPSGFGGCCG